MINYGNGKYGMSDEIAIESNSKSLIKLYRRADLTMTGNRKEVNFKFGTVVFDKTYEYGWEAALVNQGTVSKSAIDLIFRLQYSTTRKSVVTFTLANNKKSASVYINVEYFPTKSVSHSIVFTKKTQELAFDFEFLPTMHSTFNVRFDLDPAAEYKKITTDFGLQWNKFKKMASLTQLFNSNKKMFETITKFGHLQQQ